jgi:phage terminase large subunit-like protein
VQEFKPINGRIQFGQVEAVLRDWCTRYNVYAVVFDIYQIYDMTERLRKEGLAWFQEFSQANKRTLADNLLFELIVQARLVHAGQDELVQHIKNAGTAYDPMQKKRRIVKIRETRKVDLVVALAMAAWECVRLNI